MRLGLVGIVRNFCSKCLVTAIEPLRQEYGLIRDIWTGRFPEGSVLLPLTILERGFMSFRVFIRSLSLFHVVIFLRKFISGSIISEFYVIIWFLILFVILMFNASLAPWLTILIVFYRIIDGLNYRLCIIFVDRYKQDWGLRSLNRSLVLLFINYLEIIIGFAALYLVTESVGYKVGVPLSSRLDALYFSVITITTLGYGDIKPIAEVGKWLSLSEILMGFILVVLVVGSFLTGLQGIRNIRRKLKSQIDRALDQHRAARDASGAHAA